MAPSKKSKKTNKKRKNNGGKNPLPSPPQNYAAFLSCQAYQSVSRIVEQYKDDLAAVHGLKQRSANSAPEGIDIDILRNLFNMQSNLHHGTSSGSSSSSTESEISTNVAATIGKPKAAAKSAPDLPKPNSKSQQGKKFLRGTQSDPTFDEYVWVDGDDTFQVPKKYLNGKGSPHIGWAFCQNGGRK